MLTGDLVRVRVVTGEVRPGFIDVTQPRYVERAEAILSAFAEGIGQRRADLEEALVGVEGDGVDVKLTRGIAKVVFDRAEFDVSSEIPPAELRAELFRRVRARGPLADIAVEGGRPTAEHIWDELAVSRGLPVEALRDALYADHADQQRLVSVDIPSGAWLLDRYNVALVQSVLLKAEAVRVRLRDPGPGRLRQLLRAVKFHQLIFTTESGPSGYTVTLDGPASLFSQTTRYGMGLARWFPSLLLQPGAWELEADILWNRIRRRLLVSSATGLRSHYRDLGAYETREAAWFAERFEALASGWELIRDTAALHPGGEGFVVPDFSFRKGGRVAHLEILGFWRKGTIPRRLALLKRHGPANLVLAVSSRLCGEPEETLSDVIVPFAEVVPAKEVLRRIEAIAI